MSDNTYRPPEVWKWNRENVGRFGPVKNLVCEAGLIINRLLKKSPVSL